MGTKPGVLSHAITTTRHLGWQSVAALWLAATGFALSIAYTHAAPMTVSVAVATAATALLVVGVWFPRLIGTGLTLLAASPLIGPVGTLYALHASPYVSFSEVNVRMNLMMFLLAALAHTLPGRPWVRLVCVAACVAGPGLLLVQLVPPTGIFTAYLVGFGAVWIPSIRFRRKPGEDQP